MITFRTLENISLSTISETMNLAFSDYSIPITFPVETLEQKFISENITPNLSIGAFYFEKLIGVILHGYNRTTKTVYNGGTGVVPEFRGQKITQKMYHYSKSIFEDYGIAKHQLEVISDNIPAIKSYENVGFSAVRKLNCYKGSLNISNINSDIVIKRVDNLDWKLLQTFWNVQPTWQNGIQAVNFGKDVLKILTAFFKDKLVGYLIINPKTNRIHQIAISKSHRKLKIASTLFNYVKTHFSETVTIINIDENSEELNSFLETIGLENFLQQLEMKKE